MNTPSGVSQLKSGRWIRTDNVSGLVHRSILRVPGNVIRADEDRPIVGVCNSWSELVNCNLHFQALAVAVKRGITRAGGIPVEFNTLSLGEALMKPTTMLYRNLMAMEVEESLRSYPLDSVVMLGGCDKTTPAQLLGAASADVPSVFLTGGPANPSIFRGEQMGIGDLWRYTDQLRAGQITQADFEEFEESHDPSPGHCPEMGSASTMACLLEGLGVALPGSACIPATDSRRLQAAEQAGYCAVEVARAGRRPSQVLTAEALENAVTVLMGIGGSTNAILHLIALAGRLGLELPLERFDEISARTPAIVDVQPVGSKLVEQLFNSGGVPAVLNELRPLLHENAPTITGRPLRDGFRPRPADTTVVRTLENPVRPAGGLAVLRGSLAPNGAVVKPSVTDPALLEHRGPALVFDGIDDLTDRIEDLDLDVTRESVLVLRNVGPIGGPGMPEWGKVPIPGKLLRAGVRDMLRISDARMSGTAFGATVLHVAPESAVGGPLALVRNGDVISVSLSRRTLNLEVDEAELRARGEAWVRPEPAYPRGYGALFIDNVLQADEGCDFGFLRGRSASPEDEPLGLLRGNIGGW